MDRVAQEMLAAGALSAADTDYSMAIEYRGPPVTYDLPRAIPIDIDRIPVASIAAPSSLPDHLPVVHPLPSPGPTKPGSPTPLASPTSVIAFDGDADTSGAVASSSELTTESTLTSDEDFPKRPPHVTLQDPVDSSTSTGNFYEEEEQAATVKKGSCHRCLKGSIFTEKEACLVCNAKYCSGCVLRAMGSMPEGRKCVSCIGSPIEESKRERLGKSSRLLRRLLSGLEVKQAMRAESECEANQLRPEYFCVNGKKLSQEEMVLLQRCPCAPEKMSPGHYWYDKVSGFWGKDRHKPHQIISPHLNVGGALMRNASNGDTGVLINGREITKVELRMLQWAGVQCAGNPQFWVNADGTYQEEGHKKIKGQIWGKPTTKLFCSLLSLPVPSKSAFLSGEVVNDLVARAVPEYLEQRTLQKLLLVGYHGSGTSTIYKQAKFLYSAAPFSADERQNIKVMIQSNIYSYLVILLEGREIFEEESLLEKKRRQLLPSSSGNDEAEEHDVTEYSISPRLKAFSDWILQEMASGQLELIFPAAAREYAPRVEELWNDAAIQATYSRRSELPLLPTVASYFLDRVVDISRVDYEPSDMDILYADGIPSSSGLECTDFFFPQLPPDGTDTDAADQKNSFLRYQLVRVPTQGLGENCKWLNMFEDVRMVIFCVSMSDYDVSCEDASGIFINKMMESKRLFESIVANPTFDQMDFLLILNKFDVLEQKIDSTPLTLCEWFHDFNPVVSRHRTSNNNGRNTNPGASLAQQAFHYIAVKFKRLFDSLTGRKLYVTSANGLARDSVDATLRYAREILKWEEETIVLGSSEYSAFDTEFTEPSSYSH